jgi:integrase
MLTDAQLRSLKPTAASRRVSDGGGLYIQLDPNGGRYWRYNYRFDGKQKTLALGVFPDVSLAKARARHQAARQQLTEGKDPGGRNRFSEIAFEAAARRWHEHWKRGRSERHAQYVLRRLELDIFPEIGKRPIGNIKASAFRDAVQKVERRGASEISRRLLQSCGQIMRYAVANDLAPHNPVADIKPGDVLKRRKRRHYAHIGVKELPDLLRAIGNYVGSEHTQLALELMALTFVRTSELIGGRWSEFNFAEARWYIPAIRMKMKTPHIVPLGRQALDVLGRLRKISFGRDLVFPGDLDPEKTMSNNTLLFALYRLGYRGRMTGHGFRTVASTVLHEQGWPHEHIELQLAHEERDETSAAYNHALYLKPRAAMMQAWADYLDQLRQEKRGTVAEGVS